VADYTASPNYNMTPGDLATIYNFKPLFARGVYGTGTIYVIESSTLYTLNDWVYFRDVFQLPSNLGNGLDEEFPAPPSGPNNCSNPGVTGADSEAIVDAEWASAAAPGANIAVAVCGDTGVVTTGILIAVQNLLNGPNPPAIISISYGICEVDAGATMNAAINTAFQTGVAEGASIFVSAGDQAAAGCTPGGDATTPNTVNTGIGVNAWASTPYAVAVGGTDFADTYLGQNSTYWNASNGTDYSSAKSYIPEVPWDSTCANQEWASSNGYSNIFGSSGFCDSSYIASRKFYLNNWAGSGGPSGCATGAPSVSYVVSGTCAGRAKPSWQSGLVGVPNDGVRDVPDVSLFSSFAPWNHSYLICFSDTARNKTGVACNSTSSISLMSAGWGGTSFAAPIWAGIQSIINATAGGRQGNPNFRLYQIAKAEYSANANEGCNSSLNPLASCIFYDVTRGDTAVPCVADSGTYYNCYHPSGTYGVLSQDNCCYEPAYFATFGWDFATGIGTVNVANLVAAWAPKSYTHDFDGDRHSDIAWRDASGNVAVWLMNGTSILNQSTSFVANVPISWSIVGNGDYNGDGHSDILWRDSSGNVAIWEMYGTSILNQANSFVANVPTNWSIVGTGDFNGDGESDILWRDSSGNVAIWEMNGTTVLNASTSFVANVPTNWSVFGSGDYNGDSKSDILWRDGSGNVAIWEMNGTTVLNQSTSFVANVPTNWTIVGTGDFNGDRMSDILWRDGSGNVAIWEMNGTSVLNQSTSFVANVPTNWSISGSGDYNAAGKSDISWRDTSGNVAIWEMDGTSILNQSTSFVANVPTNWSIIDPQGN
jgi:subtilase family serine protease